MKSDNELIAEFMGFKAIETHNIHGVIYYHADFMGAFGEKAQVFKYNKSWDWLMPVVEKISKIHDSKFNYDFNEIKEGKWPEDNEYMEVIALPLATPITEAHKAVVQFINFYNSQK